MDWMSDCMGMHDLVYRPARVGGRRQVGGGATCWDFASARGRGVQDWVSRRVSHIGDAGTPYGVLH